MSTINTDLPTHAEFRQAEQWFHRTGARRFNRLGATPTDARLDLVFTPDDDVPEVGTVHLVLTVHCTVGAKKFTVVERFSCFPYDRSLYSAISQARIEAGDYLRGIKRVISEITK